MTVGLPLQQRYDETPVVNPVYSCSSLLRRTDVRFEMSLQVKDKSLSRERHTKSDDHLVCWKCHREPFVKWSALLGADNWRGCLHSDSCWEVMAAIKAPDGNRNKSAVQGHTHKNGNMLLHWPICKRLCDLHFFKVYIRHNYCCRLLTILTVLLSTILHHNFVFILEDYWADS